MKSVYYKRLIADKMGLNAWERIVYSNLLYDAICKYDETWDKDDGTFDAINLVGEEAIPLVSSTACNTIGKKMPISKVTAWRCIKSLEDNDLIDGRHEYIRLNDVYKSGYFTLLMDSGLKGELLIFYSWLVDLSRDKQIIYCDRNMLSALYNASINDIKYYLKQLKKLGFIERDKKNHLIIKQYDI